MLKLLSHGIAEQFGDKCEVVIHDYQKPFESTIIHIENGHVTNRKIGDSGTSIGLQVYKGEIRDDGKYNYISRTKEGKVIRSTTINIKNDEGKIVGSLCINFDNTDIILASKIIGAYANEKSEEEKETPVFGSVNDLLSSLIDESINYIGVPVSSMTREQKISGIQYLNQRGAFSIKNAAQTVANIYSVSKFTIYNYLNEKI